jgi:hypothetical protein
MNIFLLELEGDMLNDDSSIMLVVKVLVPAANGVNVHGFLNTGIHIVLF